MSECIVIPGRGSAGASRTASMNTFQVGLLRSCAHQDGVALPFEIEINKQVGQLRRGYRSLNLFV